MEFLKYKKYLQEYMKCANDPWYFIENYFKLYKDPIKLHPCQKAMIMNFDENKATIVKSPRQTGKSLISLAYAYWSALIHQKSVAIITHSRTAAENLCKILQSNIHEENIDCKRLNKTLIEFSTGGYIHFTGPSVCGTCGRNYDVVIFDEMAYIDNIEEIFNCVYPIISCHKNSKIIAVSSINKSSDLFYNLYMSAINPKIDSDWTPMEINWWDIPSFDDIEKVKSFKKMCGDNIWRREFESRF